MERGGTEVDLAGSCKASQNGGVVSGKASSYPPGGTRAQPGHATPPPRNTRTSSVHNTKSLFVML